MDAITGAVDPQIDADLRHLIARYVWALDTADVDGLMRLFTTDCVLQDTSGARYEGAADVAAYFARLTRLPAFRGRRHHIDNLVYRSTGDECRTRAYWMVEKWESASGRKVIEVTGHSEDRFVRIDGDWRFAERLLHYWTDTAGPWVPSVA